MAIYTVQSPEGSISTTTDAYIDQLVNQFGYTILKTEAAAWEPGAEPVPSLPVVLDVIEDEPGFYSVQQSEGPISSEPGGFASSDIAAELLQRYAGLTLEESIAEQTAFQATQPAFQQAYSSTVPIPQEEITAGPIIQEVTPVTMQIEPSIDYSDGIAPASILSPTIAGTAIALAIRFLRAAMGTATRVTQQHWDTLPGWARTALIAAGITVGTDMAISGDVPFIDVPGFDGSRVPSGIGMGNPIVRSWTANGRPFYMHADGRVAVQRKNGTWKIFRYKKPIVLYPSGAGDLSTLLRADSAVDKQLKKLNKAINRRAPRRRRETTTTTKPADGTTITQVKTG